MLLVFCFLVFFRRSEMAGPARVVKQASRAAFSFVLDKQIVLHTSNTVRSENVSLR